MIGRNKVKMILYGDKPEIIEELVKDLRKHYFFNTSETRPNKNESGFHIFCNLSIKPFTPKTG